MSILWILFKAILSLVTATVAGVLFVLFVRQPDDYSGLVSATVFFAFAALPWVRWTERGRTLGLIGVFFSLVMLVLLHHEFVTGAAHFPRSCHGRSSTWCELENWLYLLGGAPLAAAPRTILGACFLFFSLRTVWRHRRT